MEPITIWTFGVAARAAVKLSVVGQIGINLSAAMIGQGAADIFACILKRRLLHQRRSIARLLKQHFC
jgi:CO/xanthine dehydrogenase Mo-binding subunit